MGQGIKTLIADDNPEFSVSLKQKLSSYEDIMVAGICTNGTETLETIKVMKPDVVLLDIIMPGIDGLCVLERAASEELFRSVCFIVVTAARQDSIIRKALRLGAAYYVVKPFIVDILARRIRQMVEGRKNDSESLCRNNWYWLEQELLETGENIDIMITKVIKKMGILPNITGYHYLRKAILHAIGNDGVTGSITNRVYPSIAESFGTTSRKVERSIRNAIKFSWDRGNNEMRMLFAKKPTNSEFICTTAEWIRVSKY